VGQDDDHTVGVYDWQNKKLKSTASGDKNKSLAVAFSPDGTTVCQVCVVLFLVVFLVAWLGNYNNPLC
jgi:hypothetical protein